VSLLSLTSFSSLQSLLSKVSYDTFYLKHCKEGSNWHNPFMGYSSNSPFSFFQNNNNNNNNSKKAGVLVTT
jgi:hypothetical protein